MGQSLKQIREGHWLPWFGFGLVFERVPSVGFIQTTEKHGGSVCGGELADVEELAFTVFADTGVGVHGVCLLWVVSVVGLTSVVTEEGFDGLEEGVLPVEDLVIVDEDVLAIESVVDVA